MQSFSKFELRPFNLPQYYEGIFWSHRIKNFCFALSNIIIWGHPSLFYSKCPCIWQEQEITPQSPRQYCYFGVLKIILSKIMNGDP